MYRFTAVTVCTQIQLYRFYCGHSSVPAVRRCYCGHSSVPVAGLTANSNRCEVFGGWSGTWTCFTASACVRPVSIRTHCFCLHREYEVHVWTALILECGAVRAAPWDSSRGGKGAEWLKFRVSGRWGGGAKEILSTRCLVTEEDHKIRRLVSAWLSDLFWTSRFRKCECNQLTTCLHVLVLC